MRTAKSRAPNENADAIGLIVALLERFPEIVSLGSHHADGTLTLSFAVRKRLDKASQASLRIAVVEHLESLGELLAAPYERLDVGAESDDGVTFVRVTRDVRSVTREELQMLTALFAERFGDALIRSPKSALDETLEEDPAAADDLVEFALEALRDPVQQRSLVGFREEQGAMVYFVPTRKKAKARRR
jgi:hypothetical protein